MDNGLRIFATTWRTPYHSSDRIPTDKLLRSYESTVPGSMRTSLRTSESSSLSFPHSCFVHRRNYTIQATVIISLESCSKKQETIRWLSLDARPSRRIVSLQDSVSSSPNLMMALDRRFQYPPRYRGLSWHPWSPPFDGGNAGVRGRELLHVCTAKSSHRQIERRANYPRPVMCLIRVTRSAKWELRAVQHLSYFAFYRCPFFCYCCCCCCCSRLAESLD